MEDHFAGSPDAHGGPFSYHAPDEVAVGAGVVLCAATKGAASAVRKASVICIFEIGIPVTKVDGGAKSVSYVCGRPES